LDSFIRQFAGMRPRVLAPVAGAAVRRAMRASMRGPISSRSWKLAIGAEGERATDRPFRRRPVGRLCSRSTAVVACVGSGSSASGQGRQVVVERLEGSLGQRDALEQPRLPGDSGRCGVERGRLQTPCPHSVGRDPETLPVGRGRTTSIRLRSVERARVRAARNAARRAGPAWFSPRTRRPAPAPRCILRASAGRSRP
jgi:hypothetical protein